MFKYLLLLSAFINSSPAFAESMSDQTSLYLKIAVAGSSVSTSMNGISDQQSIFMIGNGEYTAGGIKSPAGAKLTFDYFLGQFSKINTKMSTFLNVNQMNECVRILAGAQDSKFFWMNFSFEKGTVSTDATGLKIRVVNLGNLYNLKSITCGLESR